MVKGIAEDQEKVLSIPGGRQLSTMATATENDIAMTIGLGDSELLILITFHTFFRMMGTAF